MCTSMRDMLVFFSAGVNIRQFFFDCDLRRKILMHSVGYERASNAGYVL